MDLICLKASLPYNLRSTDANEDYKLLNSLGEARTGEWEAGGGGRNLETSIDISFPFSQNVNLDLNE